MKEKFYHILVENDGCYTGFDGIEYTEKEAKEKLKELQKDSKMKFKLDYIGTWEVVTLSVNQKIW